MKKYEIKKHLIAMLCHDGLVEAEKRFMEYEVDCTLTDEQRKSNKRVLKTGSSGNKYVYLFLKKNKAIM